ncbi:hemerythrin domain-containing protein [Ensifer sp. LCM 4579]|uniref:hemerythrin domain-containing protein n=1 Tax=Ensifer sp. LCM 4579 TaxID=1848292 RepID=UPI001FCD95CA|nr:hemerythrin domain-containing protein [Ensifer sp. LCM 4579]
MAGSHQNQLTLCDHLEAIADSLPHGVDRGMCAYAAKMLGPLLRDLHVREEGVVFAWTEERFGDDPSVLTTLELLKNEHFEDECFADELAEMLGRLGTADATVNPETAGYMLRGFFTNLRRHVRFEQQCLRSLAADHSGC